VAVVVAARDLPIGTTLTAEDVRTARWPAALAPRRGFAVSRLAVGRRLAAPLARGEPVTLTRVVGRELTAGLDADHVACAVATSGDVSVLVHAGDRVDLLAAPPADPLTSSSSAAATVVARDVQVLAVLPAQPSDASSTGSELIVSTTRTSALVLAGLSGSRVLAVVGPSP
jgi:Flp pilus assembly protein CpaB